MEYEVTTEQFSGPLDLLLHLIREHNMDLMDLDVAAICDQHLAYIQTMNPALLEAVSEYLVMAAWLIEMKSKLLLPSEKIEDEEDDYEAQRQLMIKRLLEKNQINEILDELEENYEERNQMFSRLPATFDEYVQDVENALPDNLEVYDLIGAMQNVLQRQILAKPLESRIARVEISIDDRTSQIEDFFASHRGEVIDFEDLFEGGDKYFAIVTFLSVLVLVKHDQLEIMQESNFEKIYLRGKYNGS